MCSHPNPDPDEHGHVVVLVTSEFDLGV
jgi:hypothetical protein